MREVIQGTCEVQEIVPYVLITTAEEKATWTKTLQR